MTNKSFGVRLLQINYVDTEGAKTMTKLGFVIEDNDDVAERNGMYTINTCNISNDDLDRRQQNLVNVFQYLIGNTEFSLVGGEPDEYCCHNIDLMSATKRTPFTPRTPSRIHDSNIKACAIACSGASAGTMNCCRARCSNSLIRKTPFTASLTSSNCSVQEASGMLPGTWAIFSITFRSQDQLTPGLSRNVKTRHESRSHFRSCLNIGGRNSRRRVRRKGGGARNRR